MEIEIFGSDKSNLPDQSRVGHIYLKHLNEPLTL